jgi:thiol-disulfide isomerase/thioredoxin
MHKIVIIAFFSVVIMAGCKSKSDMPSFNLLLEDSITVLNTKQIPVGKPILLVFFSPDCEHCQEETINLTKKMSLLKNIEIYFISIQPLADMKYFSHYYHLKDFSNVTMVQDYTVSMPKYFKINVTPYMILFNKQKQLKVIFKGVFPVDSIVKEINKL